MDTLVHQPAEFRQHCLCHRMGSHKGTELTKDLYIEPRLHTQNPSQLPRRQSTESQPSPPWQRYSTAFPSFAPLCG